jgi:hypothetical protein
MTLRGDQLVDASEELLKGRVERLGLRVHERSFLQVSEAVEGRWFPDGMTSASPAGSDAGVRGREEGSPVGRLGYRVHPPGRDTYLGMPDIEWSPEMWGVSGGIAANGR